MSSQRQVVLNLLYNVLKNPENYGDKFFLQMVQQATNGLVAITILQNMISELNDYPIAYITYCISKDEEDRFGSSADGSKVGLKSRLFNLETDEFGFTQQSDTRIEETAADDYDRLPTVYSRMTNLEEVSLTRKPVVPVIFVDGKFYIDGEAKNTSMDHQASQQYIYDLVDIPPLGLQGEIDAFRHLSRHCFNCGGDHTLRDCTEPINKFRVAQNRKKVSNDGVRRLYYELELQEKIRDIAPGVLSSRLREALGISEDDEPPYYRNMRANGYPPGYLGKDGYQIPHGSRMKLEDIINKKAPLLKVYNGDDVETIPEVAQLHQNTTHNVKLVYYPGLNLIDTTNLTQKMEDQSAVASSYVQKQWDDYYAQQQGYYNYGYTPQDQLYPSHISGNSNTRNSLTATGDTTVPGSNYITKVDQNDTISRNSENYDSDDMDISSDDET